MQSAFIVWLPSGLLFRYDKTKTECVLTLVTHKVQVMTKYNIFPLREEIYNLMIIHMRRIQACVKSHSYVSVEANCRIKHAV